MTNVTTETKQSKIVEFNDLLRQREQVVQKKKFNLELSEYENYLLNSPYQDWLRISTMLNAAEINAEIYADFLQYPTHYKIENGEIVFNESWEDEARQREEERIAQLHITKQDFFLYLCKPANISLETLESKIAELGMADNWKLCNHVYYGVIKGFITALPIGKSEAEIIQVFETYCKAE